MSLEGTDWDPDTPPAPADIPGAGAAPAPVQVDQELLAEIARQRLVAHLGRLADAQIAAQLQGAAATDAGDELADEPSLMDAAIGAAVTEVTEVLRTEAADEQSSPAASGPDGKPQLHFASLPDFVDQFLAKVYRRKIAPKDSWCRKWWEHPEAALRLDALWRSWEALRLEPGTGMSVWLRDHADHHMARLLDPKGPFSGCTIDDKKGHGINDAPGPLPWDSAPEGLYDTPT